MTATQHAPMTEIDRAYAKAIGLAARGGAGAVGELLAAAGANPHVLGAVAERLRSLVVEHPHAFAPADALALVNEARLRALA